MHRRIRRMPVLMVILLGVCFAAIAFAQHAVPADDAKIDRYVAGTPVVAERSIASLAGYLGKAGKTDREKARAIYRWMVENIGFDIDAVQKGKNIDTSPEAVLKHRITTCDGFANLYQRLAEKTGLTAIKVLGAGKGDPFSTVMCPASHAWNLVKINGDWQLVDSTWGAGYLDSRNRFVRAPSDDYFLTSPDEFIYGHFPEDPRWQLLEPPLTREQFDELIPVSSLFFAYDMQPVTHKQKTIRTDASLEITLTAPPHLLMMAALYQDDRVLAENTFVQRTGKKLVISAVFPRAGKYRLQLLAKKKSDSGAFLGVMEYLVEVKEGMKGNIGFPKILGDFTRLEAYLHLPLAKYLKAGSVETFKLDVPDAVEVVVSDGENFIQLEREGKQTFTGDITVRKGTLLVAAKFAGGNQYKVLLEYTGE